MPSFSPQDQEYMHLALRLARRGQGWVEPNPMVGCVLVRRGRIIGQGHHRHYGGPHAEVEALRRVAGTTRGATAYVSLEPCCHFGKTPPCTQALVEAGVSRVVAAMTDPFPQVAGGGLRVLRRAGIAVQVGLLEDEAAELNAPFLTRVLEQRPYVIAKWAQSLDGRTATRTGDSRWISGPAARRYVHGLRARVDAIMVGIGTVLADDPQLTARDVAIRRVAARVIVDSRLRIPQGCRLVRTAGAVRTIVATTAAGLARAAKVRALCRQGVEILECSAAGGRVDLPAALAALHGMQFTNVLVEGGSELIGALVDARRVDEVRVFVAPKLIGGRGAPGGCGGQGVALMRDALQTRAVRWRRVGDDLLAVACLTRPARG